jgi:hypothetical protein
MPDDYPHCEHCARRIQRDRYKFIWTHAHNGFTLCHPLTDDKLTATPPPPHLPTITVKPRISGTSNDNPRRVTHLVPALNQNYRTACGKATRDAVETINQTTIKADVTCIRCQQTLAYKKHEDKEPNMSAADLSPCPTCKHPLMSHDGSFSNACQLTGCDCRPLAPAYTKSRISGSEPVPVAPKPEARVFPVKQMSMEEMQAAAYRLDPDPVPPTTGRSVYCVHCNIYHSPDDPHRVSFDYPPIPYARELFESRQADLRGEMQDYIEGRLTQDELAAVVQRIETEYVQGMHDLFALKLI